jgi:hypothetical protein
MRNDSEWLYYERTDDDIVKMVNGEEKIATY